MLPPEKLKNQHHGDEDGWQAQKLPFTKTNGDSWRKKVCGMSTTDGKIAYLGLNSPTSRHVQGRQQSRSVWFPSTFDSWVMEQWPRCSSDSLAHLIPCHISSSSKTGLNYDTTWAGKAAVKVRDIHGPSRELHGRQSKVDGMDYLIQLPHLRHIYNTGAL
jgi:hypothetical protein